VRSRACWFICAALTLGLARASEPSQGKVTAAATKGGTVELATFGSGCFWCAEAVFDGVEGVLGVTSGYSGGKKKNPSYKEVCTGLTGHAEVVRIEFDSSRLTYRALLDLFWKSHDPTTPNRQGGDEGTQYRSAIFYHSEEQKKLALEAKAALEKARAFRDPIVTQIEPAGEFYAAEPYHQNYFRNNPEAPYCRAVIAPKLKNLKK
jgi:peptide-methionine (S)-S-oxide reductase